MVVCLVFGYINRLVANVFELINLARALRRAGGRGEGVGPAATEEQHDGRVRVGTGTGTGTGFRSSPRGGGSRQHFGTRGRAVTGTGTGTGAGTGRVSTPKWGLDALLVDWPSELFVSCASQLKHPFAAPTLKPTSKRRPLRVKRSSGRNNGHAEARAPGPASIPVEPRRPHQRHKSARSAQHTHCVAHPASHKPECKTHSGLAGAPAAPVSGFTCSSCLVLVRCHLDGAAAY